MEYGQRPSGIFVRQNLIPQNDLQAEHTYQAGQYVLPDIHQALAYNVGQGPYGPRMLQTDASGNLLTFGSGGYETLPVPTRTAIVASRVDTASGSAGDFSVPAFTVALFILRVDAVSGTTPSMTVTLLSKNTGGLLSTTMGGIAFTAITAVGAQAQVINSTLNTSAALIGPISRISWTITGTTPSFTWYMDMVYK